MVHFVLSTIEPKPRPRLYRAGLGLHQEKRKRERLAREGVCQVQVSRMIRPPLDATVRARGRRDLRAIRSRWCRAWPSSSSFSRPGFLFSRVPFSPASSRHACKFHCNSQFMTCTGYLPWSFSRAGI